MFNDRTASDLENLYIRCFCDVFLADWDWDDNEEPAFKVEFKFDFAHALHQFTQDHCHVQDDPLYALNCALSSEWDFKPSMSGYTPDDDSQSRLYSWLEDHFDSDEVCTHNDPTPPKIKA